MEFRYVEAGEMDAAYAVMKQLRTELSRFEFDYLRRDAEAGSGYKLLGAFDGGQCVGLMGYRVLADFVHGRHLYIDDLVVDAHLRSKGLGAKFLKEAERIAREQGCRGLRLCTGVDMKDAQRFYEREGWQLRAVAYKKRI